MDILRINNNYQEVINKTAAVIKKGGLVIFPSDTVYILAVDPTNKEAVDKLLGFKNRWTGKAISVAVTDVNMAKVYVELTDNAYNIYSNLLPGPFTIVSKGKHKVAKGIEAENGTLGVRIPNDKAIYDLVSLFKKPITATSANLAGRTPHYSIESFLHTLSQKKKGMIDLVVDAGKLPKNIPSTVIDATDSELKILRRGDLITGKSATLISKSEKETEKIARFLVNKILGSQKAIKPVVIGLSGDLGCGKTVFSRAVAKYLDIKDKITSPTFVIYNEYKIPHSINTTLEKEVKNKFLHFDLYRIRDQYELEEIKYLQLFEPGVIACIEWPENMGKETFEKLKKITDYKAIHFEYIDPETREIKYEI